MMKAQEESDRRWEEFKKSIPIVDAAGRTSLHREMLAENPKTYNVGEILKSIPVDATDKDGNTALMLLVQRDDQNYHSSWLDAPEIVRKLLDAGASLTKTNKRNQSALDLATPEAYKILDPNNESLTPTRALKHKIQRWVKQVKEFVNDHLEMFS
jgi:ankyrin repeat protein